MTEPTPKVKNGTPWILLFSISVLRVGVMSILNYPALFEGLLIKDFNITTLEVSYLYTAMAIPNIFCNIFGSILAQKIGLGFSSILFTLLPFTSIVITFVGYYHNKFTLLIIGRVIFGFAFENILVLQAMAAEKYFNSGKITVILALNRTISNLVQSITAFYQPVILSKTRSFHACLLTYGLISLISFTGAVILTLRELKDNASKEEEKENEEVKEVAKFGFRDIFKIRPLGWMMVIAGGLYYQGYMQFIYFANDFLHHRLTLNPEESKKIVASLPFQNMILIPMFSFVIWKMGKKSIFLLIGSIFLFFGYFYMSLLPKKSEFSHAIIAATLLNMFWCFMTPSLWPGLIINMPKQGTGFMMGMSFSIQNILSAVISPFFGALNKPRDYDAYQRSLKYLFFFSIFLVLYSVLIIIVDFSTGKILFLSETSEKVQEMKDKFTKDFENSEKKSLNIEIGENFDSESVSSTENHLL